MTLIQLGSDKGKEDSAADCTTWGSLTILVQSSDMVTNSFSSLLNLNLNYIHWCMRSSSPLGDESCLSTLGSDWLSACLTSSNFAIVLRKLVA